MINVKDDGIMELEDKMIKNLLRWLYAIMWERLEIAFVEGDKILIGLKRSWST